MPKKIYYHDTDSGGVVYYANYLKYFEEGRTEFLREKGIDIKELSQKNILFIVRNTNIDYKAPSAYGDTLEIFTEIKELKNASIEFLQQAKREGRLLVSASVQLVCVNNNFKITGIPEEVAKKISANITP
ncbi:MAG: YbgC/FadM family acyl-CoA thioesterase [bacterium]